jgi:hypothetical protein
MDFASEIWAILSLLRHSVLASVSGSFARHSRLVFESDEGEIPSVYSTLAFEMFFAS